ncbi:hypothetical protein Zmor_028152 [Zophobas morio]|uniref:Uncharacterized protein n=1 Tax=Zophobas morio TaxID=2755281 RepID=A0AA38HSB8_9CUCU|nr:hypothetical protein Zmor_028152 [Zophobas morio]
MPFKLLNPAILDFTIHGYWIIAIVFLCQALIKLPVQCSHQALLYYFHLVSSQLTKWMLYINCSHLPVAMFSRGRILPLHLFCFSAAGGVEVEDLTLFFDPEVFLPAGCLGLAIVACPLPLGFIPEEDGPPLANEPSSAFLPQPRRFASS